MRDHSIEWREKERERKSEREGDRRRARDRKGERDIRTDRQTDRQTDRPTGNRARKTERNTQKVPETFTSGRHKCQSVNIFTHISAFVCCLSGAVQSVLPSRYGPLCLGVGCSCHSHPAGSSRAKSGALLI